MNFSSIESGISEKSWLSFYLNIGRKFYEANRNTNSTLNICISVPSLYYVAAGIGLGICDRLYSSDVDENGEDILKQLKPGTLVFYRSPFSKTEKSYTMEGLTKEGYPVIKGTGKNPETITLMRPQLWQNVRVAPEQITYKRNRTMKTSGLQTVIYEYYDRGKIDNILRNPRINILFIGNERRLKEEMSQEFEDGHLPAEWLLPKSMNGTQRSYVSDVVPSGTRPESLSLNSDTILIFDGVHAFTQSWYRNLPNPCIILLERTASVDLLMSGLDLLNRSIDSRGVSAAEDFIDTVANFSLVPGNIELTAWRRRKQ